jgi:pyruvate dehydrogenase E2 component (dihydrolipoamide acetyltransferase)
MAMPDLSSISESVTLLHWLVPIGSDVRRGDPLVEVQTDKAVMVVESTQTGTLKRILAEPGQDVPVGTGIAVFEVDRPAAEPARPMPPAPTPASPVKPAEPAAPPPTPARGGSFFARNRQGAKPDPSSREDAK